MLDFLPPASLNWMPSTRKDTRSGFGQGLLEVGQSNDNVVALCADLTGSLKMNAFRDAFPGPLQTGRHRRGQHDWWRGA